MNSSGGLKAWRWKNSGLHQVALKYGRLGVKGFELELTYLPASFIECGSGNMMAKAAFCCRG